MKPKLTTRILKHILITSAVIAVATALIWIALQGYSAPWTGFADFTKPNSDFIRGKTLWDWMQLFIIPIFLSIGVFFLNRSERESERKRAEERANNEREIATDRQREAALQSYLDRMADIVLKDNLRTAENEKVRNVARTRTLTVLRGLDATRKGIVLTFLHEAGLIRKENPIVNLNIANLEGAHLELAHLENANLESANMQSAHLENAHLEGAYLQDVRLEFAHLEGAYMQGANLENAHLKSANFEFADLGNANLKGARFTKEQLETARSLKGATMPDGTIHD